MVDMANRNSIDPGNHNPKCYDFCYGIENKGKIFHYPKQKGNIYVQGPKKELQLTSHQKPWKQETIE